MPQDPDYFHGEGIDGVKHFALWPLANARSPASARQSGTASVPAPTA